MNNRTRQYMRACEKLERHDPYIVAYVPSGEHWAIGKVKFVKVFRRSKLLKMREEYGDELEIIMGMEDSDHENL